MAETAYYDSTLTGAELDEAFRRLAGLDDSLATAADAAEQAAFWAGQAQTIANGALGWYETSAALQKAHPTAQPGQWALVGKTRLPVDVGRRPEGLCGHRRGFVHRHLPGGRVVGQRTLDPDGGADPGERRTGRHPPPAGWRAACWWTTACRAPPGWRCCKRRNWWKAAPKPWATAR